MWITAKYDGACTECEQDIKAGQRIVFDRGQTYCNYCGVEVDDEDPLSFELEQAD